jgi:exo-beta-1,3-glucanase (GH17 family)
MLRSLARLVKQRHISALVHCLCFGFGLFCVFSRLLPAELAHSQIVHGSSSRIGLMPASPPPPLFGVNFSPYEQGRGPNVNPQVSADQIRARLQIIAPYTTWVRSFSTTTGLENIPRTAHSLGLKVAAGAWISKNLTQNDAEIADLIAAANAGDVDLAIVGSEVLLRGDVSETQLIDYMKRARQVISAGIPVTTADAYGMLLAHPNVVVASDVIAGNFYPYWENQAVGNAACDLISEYNELVGAAGGKEAITSEPVGRPVATRRAPLYHHLRTRHNSRFGLYRGHGRIISGSFTLKHLTKRGRRTTKALRERTGGFGIKPVP